MGTASASVRPAWRWILAAGVLLVPLAGAAEEGDQVGLALYDRLCALCHGVTGRGDGLIAYLYSPMPRDLTRGAYKWKSTPSGQPPLLSDIERTISVGVAGTSMPAWRGALVPEQIRALARHVRSFSPRLATAPEPRGFGRPALPEGDRERGREVWLRAHCDDCHGPEGRGDGPSVLQLRNDEGGPADVYDLTLFPPRGGRSVDDLVRSLRTGNDGTPMPSYDDALGLAEFADLSEFVRSLQGGEARRTHADGSRDPRLPGWWSRGTPPAPPPPTPRSVGLERELWYFPLRPQGPRPPHLAPAEASLDPVQCGRCHAQQHAEWSGSIHARAMGPGFIAQILDDSESYWACRDCHAPLAEQRGVESAHTRQGITCAGCHLREWERLGPPRTDLRRIVPANYPLTVLGRYERADFCFPCHQHDMFTAVNGKPLLDTFREFVATSYFRRGLACQSCHMPERAHTWRGARDPDAVRQAFRFDAVACRDGTGARATIRLANVGAGHRVPTTPTPLGLLQVVLLDGNGDPVEATRRTVRIGREVTARGGRGWREQRDTRLAPGEARRIEWRTDASGDAVKVVLEWRPDSHYERLYADRLAMRPPEPAASEYREALGRAQSSPFVVFERTLELEWEDRCGQP